MASGREASQAPERVYHLLRGLTGLRRESSPVLALDAPELSLPGDRHGRRAQAALVGGLVRQARGDVI